MTSRSELAHVPPMTADEVVAVLDLALHVAQMPQQLSVADSVRLARALLRFRELLAREMARAIVPGARFRLSTQLLQDIDAMPGRESCTVRLVRIEMGADDVGVLVVEPCTDGVA